MTLYHSSSSLPPTSLNVSSHVLHSVLLLIFIFSHISAMIKECKDAKLSGNYRNKTFNRILTKESLCFYLLIATGAVEVEWILLALFLIYF